RANSNDKLIERVNPKGEAFFKYKMSTGIDPLTYAKNRILVIVPIISLPISIPDALSALFEMPLFLWYNSYRAEEIEMATSMTAPRDPINRPAKKTSLYGLVKNCISS